ncbi:kinase-like domain-containing protein [Stachybotrys elegans]|uniref:Kinase-like domain-containing protein n=1 Tax=Stachybotrys elegans TaxID=80388 RepID=A0A8K0WV84_9HYPO|nr:kinase-like domain-containing protein [Stachybotrys elegans]
MDSPSGYLHLEDAQLSDAKLIKIPIWPRDIVKVGRDPRSNTFAIETDVDNMVSRNHCEFYVVEYEPSVHYVYVRDRKSFNGTFEQCNKPPTHELTTLQKEECELFKDKFTVSRLCLGYGSEAVVHLASETNTHKQLVCKLITLGKANNKSRGESRKRILEADILRGLEHPNILPYIDAVISPHNIYIFTELASGGDLMSFIFRHDFITEFDTRIILRQVLRGLQYLHDKGIVHRDLKPENILFALSPKIAYHRVMLSDFGACGIPEKSRMLSLAGTTHYQAPEARHCTEAQTPAVDMWATGLVALLLLTHSMQDEYGPLNCLDPEAIDALVSELLDHNVTRISHEAKNFVMSCLKVPPLERITASDAVEHGWFCSPKMHLEFFQEMDQRMLSTQTQSMAQK